MLYCKACYQSSLESAVEGDGSSSTVRSSAASFGSNVSALCGATCHPRMALVRHQSWLQALARSRGLTDNASATFSARVSTAEGKWESLTRSQPCVGGFASKLYCHWQLLSDYCSYST
jgi:hypothetical protein